MKIFLVNFLLLISFNLAAQEPEQALVRVKYSFSHMRDTTDRQKFYQETMVLISGKNASVFLSLDKITRDATAKAAFQQQIREQGGVLKHIVAPPRKRPVLETEIYTYYNEGKIFTQDRLGQLYLYEEPLEKINWKITKDTLTIEGLRCRKANAQFKGRNWSAWFVEDLPFPTGPWKLNGLPGLVVKANDDRNEVIFDFAGLEKVEAGKEVPTSADPMELNSFGSSEFLTSSTIKLPTKVTRATPKEVERLKEAMRSDPQGFAKAQLSAMGITSINKVSGSPINSRTDAANRPGQLNNPIERKKP